MKGKDSGGQGGREKEVARAGELLMASMAVVVWPKTREQRCRLTVKFWPANANKKLNILVLVLELLDSLSVKRFEVCQSTSLLVNPYNAGADKDEGRGGDYSRHARP